MLTSRPKIIILTAIATLALLSLPSTMLNELQIDATTDCDSSYPDECIPAYPPDLNCGDISDKRFQVLYPDPHGFDRDGDGIGCES
jgi:micrococcal nuclease